MKKLILAAIILSAMGSYGCVNIPKTTMTTPFNEADFAPYRKNGTATITGQAFLKTRGGEVRYGAGDTVFLTPFNAYSSEIINAQQQYGVIKNRDGRYMSTIRTTTADATGNFEFKNIPAGSYFVQCTISWQVPGIYGMSETGGTALKSVQVDEGQQTKVVLTQ